MNPTLRNILRILFFVSIGVFFIWIFVRQFTPEQKTEIFDSVRNARYEFILLALFLGVLSHLFRALRWTILLEAVGKRPRIANVFMATLIGYLANLALPRLGEVSRCGILTRYEKIPFEKSFGTVVTERMIDLLTFVTLFFILVFTEKGNLSGYIREKIYQPLAGYTDLLPGGYVFYILLGVAVVGLALLYLFRKYYSHLRIYKKISSLVKGLLLGMKSLFYIKKPFQFIFYTLSIWAMYLFMGYVVFFALTETSRLSLDAGFAILVLGSIGTMLVQGGIGIYPAIVAETLYMWNIALTKGYAMGWLIWSAQTLLILLAGIFSLLLLPMLNKSAHESKRNPVHQTTDS